MKKNTLTLGVCAVLLLGSTLAVAESDYPAADFQPKVLFTDEGANDTAVKNKPKANIQAAVTQTNTASNNTTPEVSAVTKTPGSGSTSLLGLLALAAVGGFLYYKKQGGLPFGRSTSKNNSRTYAYVRDASGLSGVTRYLKNRELLSASGVARYLAQQENVTTKAQSSNGGEATGVAKYLKNRT
ncbi:MAG: hypothetical protein HOP02_01100 [Methylococcaceae bacterium]|nr:hypothetical protein [Methylococcaceae bacterium]